GGTARQARRLRAPECDAQDRQRGGAIVLDSVFAGGSGGVSLVVGSGGAASFGFSSTFGAGAALAAWTPGRRRPRASNSRFSRMLKARITSHWLMGRVFIRALIMMPLSWKLSTPM